MGDKTQLLALMLATRFKKPWTIMAGILVATLANHGLAALVGAKAIAFLPSGSGRYVLGAVFLGFAVWILVPDKADEDSGEKPGRGAFLTTVVSFFFAEMGDKTQLATVGLGARYTDFLAVTAGTTLGMLLADGLAVFLGERLTRRIPMAWVRRAAALLFAAFGIGILLGVGQ